MKKRIFTMIGLLFILLFSCTYAGAIDLTQDKYVKVYEDMTKAIYMNIDSPTVTRYDPPYYIIRGEMVYQDYTKDTITVYTDNYFYDYTYQVIGYQPTGAATVYFSDGTIDSTPFPVLDPVAILPKGSIGSNIGDKYFSICYNIPFYKN